LGSKNQKYYVRQEDLKGAVAQRSLDKIGSKNQNLNYYIQTPKFVMQYMINSVIPHKIHLNIENHISLSTIIYASYFYAKKYKK